MGRNIQLAIQNGFLLASRLHRDSLEDIAWIAGQPLTADEKLRALLRYCAHVRGLCERQIARSAGQLDPSDVRHTTEQANRVSAQRRALRSDVIETILLQSS